MIIPLQITWRNVAQSDAIEAAIRDKARKLDQFYDHIMSCRVLVEAAHRRHHQGNLYRIRIELTVPEEELVVTRDPGDQHAHEDVYVAIRDAFDAARRQIQDYAAKRRGQVKHHEEHRTARIKFVNADEDYGFLQTEDGREIYFHRNALANTNLDDLEKGAEVMYVEEQGREGPQARQVSLGKHHPPTRS